MNQVQDLLTGEMFTPKKSTQKFASSSNRIIYHNRKFCKLRRSLSKVDRPLLNNRKIILSLLGSAKEVVKSKEFLLGAGYDFRFFTCAGTDKEGRYVSCVYEFIISSIGDGKYKLSLNESF